MSGATLRSNVDKGSASSKEDNKKGNSKDEKNVAGAPGAGAAAGAGASDELSSSTENMEDDIDNVVAAKGSKNAKETKKDSKTLINDLGNWMAVFGLSEAMTDKNHPLGYVIVSAKEFVQDSIRLVRRCSKPDHEEFKNILFACTLGMFIMGIIGYVVKLMFIPMNNIIVGGGGGGGGR